MSNFPVVPANNISLSKRRAVYGVGINDADYVTQPTVDGIQYMCPYYTKWCGMIKRCYSVNYQSKHPSYRGCEVCGDWLLFSNFRKWMKSQDWNNKELDKDLLIRGNKTYSPDACVFISQALNSLFVGRPNTGMKKGVSWHEKTKRFHARVTIGGKKKSLRYFDTEEEANLAYLKAKRVNIVKVANEQADERIKKSLLDYATNIQPLTVEEE
tara:strand:+ start:173 stop:808 length:636 start_codon:yes stop_codon:yes gene_type:complete